MAYLITMKADNREIYARLSKEMYDAKARMLESGHFLAEIQERGLKLRFIVQYKKYIPEKAFNRFVYGKLKSKLKKEFKGTVTSELKKIDHDFEVV